MNINIFGKMKSQVKRYKFSLLGYFPLSLIEISAVLLIYYKHKHHLCSKKATLQDDHGFPDSSISVFPLTTQ